MIDTLISKATFSVDDAGIITGIAWPYGEPDSVGDVIQKGAFTFAAEVPMVMEHDGRRVIGVWKSFKETETGLEVTGRLFLEAISPARDAYQLVRKGVITGLSIFGQVTAGNSLPNGGRNIHGVTVSEISLCKQPVNDGARITLVKSIIESNLMENEIINAPENETNPAVNVEEFKALKEEMKIVKAKLNRPSVALNNPDIQGDNLEVKAFGQMLRKGIERINTDIAKALTVSNDANGGFLAPAEFGNELIKLLNEYSPIRQYARVVNISSSEIKYPRRVSGTAATWVGETDDRTTSGMNFEQLTLAPHELATFTDVSNQLLEDNAYALESELLADFAESFGKTEGLAFIKGTGIGQPKGIMTAEGIKTITTGAADGFSDTNPADTIIGMYHTIATTHAHNGVWLMNRKTLGTIRQWKDGNGRYLIVDPITAGGASTLLGRPVVEMPDMDDIAADQAPILFGDLSGYRIVDRIGLSTLRDPYTLAGKGQVRFHARKRVGAGLTHPDRFVKLVVGA